MAAAAQAPPTLSTNHPVADGDDSNLSSPLSEVDDKDGELDDPDSMTLDHPAPREDASDSDSLSEANDTEAETERLYDTPQVSRQKNLVLSQIDEEDATETTPTKPSTVVVGGAALDTDNSLSDVDMSAPPSSPPEEPLSPTKATRSTSPDANGPASEPKKRKRSPAADRSDSETPLRKRIGSVGVSSLEAAGKNIETTDSDAKPDEAKSLLSSARASPVEHGDGAESAQREDSLVPEPIVTKKMTRNGSKQAKAAIANGADNQEDEAPVENDEEGRKDDEGVEADVEEDLDAAAKHDEEEAEKKRVAVEEWTAIEQKFNVFRDRLYKDRLEKLEREEQALTADEPYHVEYLNMKQCLDELHEEKLRKINKEYDYTLTAHDEVAVSRLSMVWSQFYQGVREARLEMLSGLNQEWHDTQNARRHAHTAPDYALLFPSSPAQRVRNAVAYNTEVSILSGMAIHEGFPAAPSMHGVSTAEVEDDLEAMKRARRQRQQSMQQNPTHSVALDAAGEQFIRNTPWANPSHPHHTKKATAGSSSEGQGAAQAKAPRVNGQHPAPQAGLDKPQNPVVTVSAESVRSPAVQTKRVRSLPEPSGTPTKTGQEPSMAKQGLLAASSGS